MNQSLLKHIICKNKAGALRAKKKSREQNVARSGKRQLQYDQELQLFHESTRQLRKRPTLIEQENLKKQAQCSTICAEKPPESYNILQPKVFLYDMTIGASKENRCGICFKFFEPLQNHVWQEHKISFL